MSPRPRPRPSAHELLEHLDWIQALARRLCADAGVAEDVGQDVALTLLERPPGKGVPIRAWVTTVLRNRVRQGQRSGGRRAEREREVARAERVPSAGELVERASVQRRVVDAVLELDDPYRTTILRRYFEEMGPSAIAQLEGVSVETVKTRLRRGMAQLRERLDAEYGGDGRAWSLALLTIWTPDRGAASVALTGTSIMTFKQLVLPAAVALAAVFGTWKLIGGGGGAEPRAGALDARAGVELEAPPPGELAISMAGEGGAEPVRISMGAAVTAEPEPEPLPEGGIEVHVAVVDLDSNPVPDVEVRQHEAGAGGPGELVGRSDSEGQLTARVTRSSRFLRVDSDAWTTVFEGSFLAVGSRSESTVVVAPPRDVEGRVLDEAGAPVAGASVVYSTLEALRARLAIATNVASGARFETTTDAAGAFAFLGVPELPGSVLSASVPGRAELRQEIADAGQVYSELTLPAGGELPGTVAGRVIDATGAPVAGAWVSLGGESRASDSEGRFALPEDGPLVGDVARALLAGYLPAEVAMGEDGAWPDPLVLQLGGAPLSLRGRVENEDGEPRAGVHVKVHSPTPFGLVAPEEGAAGSWVLSSGGGPAWMQRWAEDLIGGPGASLEAVTDEQGRFELSGLLDKPYLLMARDPDSLQGNSSTWVDAGSTDVTLVLEDVEWIERIAGRVSDSAGTPLAGVYVNLRREAAADFERQPTASLMGRQIQTGDDGRFEFGRTAAGSLWLDVIPGADFPFRQVLLDDEEDPTDLEIVFTGLGQLQVVLLAEPELADRFQLLDERGEPVWLQASHGLGTFSMDEAELSGGRSQVFSVTAGARTLVLYRGTEEVERRELVITVGEPLQVEF